MPGGMSCAFEPHRPTVNPSPAPLQEISSSPGQPGTGGFAVIESERNANPIPRGKPAARISTPAAIGQTPARAGASARPSPSLLPRDFARRTGLARDSERSNPNARPQL